MQVSGAKTKRQAVDRALRELVACGSVYRALRKLRGKLPWEGDVRTATPAPVIVLDTAVWAGAELLSTDQDFTAIARHTPRRLSAV